MTAGFFFSSFPSPHSFLFLCYYDFGASRAYETCLLTLFTQMTANFFGLVFKKSARCFQRILPICQSVPFACCRRCFRSFGINAAHSLDHCFQRILAICQSVPFAYGRRGFRSFGINAAHSLDHCFQRILAICQSVPFAYGRRGFR